MSAKHTPGPWIGPDRIGRFKPAHEWSASHDSSACTSSAPIWAGDKVVALVVDAREELLIGEPPSFNANARLIAAAPKLLVEIKKARDFVAEQLASLVESVTNQSTGLIEDAQDLMAVESEQDLLNSIDAAIAAAEGN